MRTLAIIPARGGSKRLKDKNIQPLGGVPLVAWTIRFAKACVHFDTVLLSTDCPAIGAVGEAEGLTLPFLRSAATASDTASSASVVMECLDRLDERGEHYDLVALLQPTTPYRRPERWDEAYALLAAGGCDTVVSAKPLPNSLWHGFTRDADGGVAFLFDEASRQARAQDVPALYGVNGSLYLSKTSTIRQHHSMIGGRCKAVICDDPLENIDIDTLEDMAAAELALEGCRLS